MKNRLISMLRWSEQYTKTDMVYLASGTFWGYLNAAVVSIFAFVISIFFARYFSKEAYGMYQYVLSIAGLIGATTLTGMNSAVTRAVARGHEGELKPAVRYQLIAGIIPFLIGLGVAAWYFIHGNQHLGFAFIAIAVLLPLGNAFNTWAAYMGGKKMFRVGSYYGLSQNLFTYTITLLVIFFARDFLWMVLANFFLSFLTSFVIYNIAIRQFPPNDLRDDETKNFGTHLSAMSILGVFAGQLDSLLIFHFVGSAALAIYSFATLIPERLTGLLKLIPNLAMPKLADKTEVEVQHILSKKLWYLIGMLAVFAIVYAGIAPWIFHTFFPKYSDSILFTQVYALSFFSLAATIVNTALTSQRRIKDLYIINSAMPIVRAILMAGLMYLYGIWGLLWAQIFGNFVSLGFQLMLFYKSSVIRSIARVIGEERTRKLKQRLKLLFRKKPGLTASSETERVLYGKIKDDMHVVFDVRIQNELSFYKIKPDCDYHLFEPNKKFVKLIKKQVATFKDHRIILNEFGLSDETLDNCIYYEESESFIPNPTYKNKPIDTGMRFSLKKMDDYVSANKISHIDFLKIDTEGFDYKVLRGGLNTINKDMVSFIQFEYWDGVRKFVDMLSPRYTMYLVMEPRLLGAVINLITPKMTPAQKSIDYDKSLILVDENLIDLIDNKIIPTGCGGNIFCVHKNIKDLNMNELVVAVQPA